MSLWHCTKCGRLMANSMVCRLGCGETSRVTHIDTDSHDVTEMESLSYFYEISDPITIQNEDT